MSFDVLSSERCFVSDVDYKLYLIQERWRDRVVGWAVKRFSMCDADCQEAWNDALFRLVVGHADLDRVLEHGAIIWEVMAWFCMNIRKSRRTMGRRDDLRFSVDVYRDALQVVDEAGSDAVVGRWEGLEAVAEKLPGVSRDTFGVVVEVVGRVGVEPFPVGKELAAIFGVGVSAGEQRYRRMLRLLRQEVACA